MSDETNTDDLTGIGRRVLDGQPFSRWINARLERLDAGSAELVLSVTERLLQQHGHVHGGVLAYLADNAMAFAGGSVLRDVVTLEFKINYVKPTKGALQLRAQAEVVGRSKRTAVCRCELFAEVGNGWVQVAVAQGTVQAVGAEQQD